MIRADTARATAHVEKSALNYVLMTAARALFLNLREHGFAGQLICTTCLGLSW